MDTASDNPLRRFSSFWLGLSIFFSFAVLCVFLAPLLKGRKAEAADAAAAELRIVKREAMREAAKAALKVDPSAVFAEAGRELLSAKPEAVETNAQVVPGTPTAAAIASAPAEEVTIETTDPEAPIDPAALEAGKAQYILCQACHGPNGEGVAGLAPPLANSEWVAGPVENLIRIQLRGLTGPITVNGTEYTLPAPMIAQAFQTDEQVAAVLTYVRNSFGNKASGVTPEQVKAFRGEVGKPALAVADLIPPGKPAPANP